MNTKPVLIEGKPIGGSTPYIIAEIGGNFTDFATARKLVDLAVDAGADAVKMQHYTAETITSREAVFEMENTGRVSQFDLFKKYEIGEALTAQVFAHCRARSVAVFSTPSHATDVELLGKFDPPAWKIGSDDAVNLPFLRHVARLGKPVLLSTGMCTMLEVERAVDAVLGEGNGQLVLLHCTTNYPCHPGSVNLGAMTAMQRRFAPIPVGYSDHTLGLDACHAAAVLGAAVLEFHFTHDKKADGPDHMLSKDAAETAELVRRVRALPVLLGDGIKRPAATEMNTRRNNRKSLVATAAIPAGGRLTAANVEIKRPGTGIPAEQYEAVLGKTVSRAVKADQVLRWEDLS